LTALLGTFDIFNQESKEIRTIDIVEDPEDRNLEFVKQEWTPRLVDCRGRAVIAFKSLPTTQQTEQEWQEKQAKFGAPDAHWDWNRKSSSMLGSAHRIFALLDSNSVEGLMRIDLSKQSRFQHSSYTPIVYIDYLAVAPWNRKVIQSPPRFRGFGTVLLGVAVSISIEEGMGGKCGLHALRQAEGFYLQAGMNDLGIDSDCGLRYFEFNLDAAKAFLGEGR